MSTLNTLNPPTKRWIVDLLLVTLAVGLFLPVHLLNRQYAHAHWAADEAIRTAREQPGNGPEKYSQVLRESMRDIGSPEAYYRRRERIRNWTAWLFLLTWSAGLLSRRWAASALVFIFWWLSWSCHGLRY